MMPRRIYPKRFNAGYITGSRIYSQENYARGLKFPDVIVLAGTADSLDMPTVGSMSDGFFEYNSMEDRLYDIRYEPARFERRTPWVWFRKRL